MTTGRERARVNLLEEESPPRKKLSHEIGQDLALLSVDELEQVIALLQAEIRRLDEAMTAKRGSRDAAAAFFKR